MICAPLLSTACTHLLLFSDNTQAKINSTTKHHKKNSNGDGDDDGSYNDNDKKTSNVLTITRTVAKQLDKQRRGWPAGHVRQTLRCRPGLVPRVIGRNGVGLNTIVVRDERGGGQRKGVQMLLPL